MQARMRRSRSLVRIAGWCLAAVLLAGSAGLAAPAPRFKTETLVRKKPFYDVEVKYPAIVRPRSAAEQRFNDGWRRAAQAEVARFEKEVPKEPPREGIMKSNLDLAHEVYFNEADLVGVRSLGGEFTGGAHPSPMVQTQLFDLRLGRAVSFREMFRSGSDFLGVVSRACIQELDRRKDLNSEANWIRQGAGPRLDNFKVFEVRRGSLVVVFPPYQVAPYSSGTQEVVIPLRALERVLDPRGPLGRLR